MLHRLWLVPTAAELRGITIEIIAFDKIIIDVKQRHKAFFEKLGIDL